MYAGIALATIAVFGTVGYWFVGSGKYSLVDCLYMTFITVTTIGYGEIIDMSGNPWGRIFTMFVAFSGIGVLTFMFSNVTAFIVAGEMTDAFRRRKMEKIISGLSQHYIVCGVGDVGLRVMEELAETKRSFMIIDNNKMKIEKARETFEDCPFLEGDATDDDLLYTAMIKEAKGLFAITGDDNKNLVICLTAKQLNPKLRVVARCHDLKNAGKIKKAGADAVVSPTFIGGLRMASEMVRSTVVSFLDTMLRDREKNLRVEEIVIPDSLSGKSLSALNLIEYPNILLMAVKTGKDWVYNPPSGYVLKSQDILVFMATPEELKKLESDLQADRS
jgi:voltage-gated potassium channel